MTGTVVLTAGRTCVITPCEVCGAAMIQTIDDQVDRVAQHYRWHSDHPSEREQNRP
jgi:hypothetical protein